MTGDGMKLTGGGALDNMRARTRLGQAHFAGSGPPGKTCRECAYFGVSGYSESTRILKDGPCKKFVEISHETQRSGKAPTFPHTALACKYFKAAEVPAPIKKPSGAWK